MGDRAGGENDREMLRNDVELAEADGYGLGGATEAEAGLAVELLAAMGRRIDTDHAMKKQRHRGRLRRRHGLGHGGGNRGFGHSASPAFGPVPASC